VLQHVHSNYEIDLFQDLIRAAVRETGAKDYLSPSLRVIADHIRACAFLIVDGVIPAARAAATYCAGSFAARSATATSSARKRRSSTGWSRISTRDGGRLSGAAPERLRVAEVLKLEEERFGETIEHGMKMLEQALAGGGKVLDGTTAFTLYDTFGFPLDLTAMCAASATSPSTRRASTRRWTSSASGRGRPASSRPARSSTIRAEERLPGYEALSVEGRVAALYKDGTSVPSLAAGERGIVVLSETPFYAESGGQVGDRAS